MVFIQLRAPGEFNTPAPEDIAVFFCFSSSSPARILCPTEGFSALVNRMLNQATEETPRQE